MSRTILSIVLRTLLGVSLLAASAVSFAAEFTTQPIAGLDRDEPEFLKVDEAFVFQAELAGDGSVLATWRMPDGYYLYRHRFAFRTADGSPYSLGEAEIPPGKKKIDDYFGEVEVYYHEARARVPLSVPVGASGPVELLVSYQGCADLGLCYPPETKQVSFAAPAAAPTGIAAAAPPASGAGGGGEVIQQERLTNLLSGGSMLAAIAFFFVAGLGLAFTPCVLPMVPILSSIIVGASGGGGAQVPLTRTRASTLSLAYVLGMAFTYAALGVLVGLFGARMNLQAMLQSPPVLIGFAAVFVALALSMFGFYEIRLPERLQNRLNDASQRQAGGKHGSVAIMGSLSALVVSPCVSAPLAAALIYLSTTSDAVLGGSALLALGLGMGTPLLVIGASGGHLLPRAGAWMTTVKAVFGVLLLAVAIWLLERVVAPPVTLLLWAALAIGSGVYLGALDFSPRQGWGQLWKASGVVSCVYGVLLLIGAASGAENPLRPLERFAAGGGGAPAATDTIAWRAVDGPEQVAAALGDAGGRPSMLDLYADWCISCKVMERNVFPAVRQDLNRFQLLRADVTENDAPDKALLEAYGLFGPPSLLFFAPDGRELVEFRVQGELDAGALAAHLGRISAHLATLNVDETTGNVGELARM